MTLPPFHSINYYHLSNQLIRLISIFFFKKKLHHHLIWVRKSSFFFWLSLCSFCYLFLWLFIICFKSLSSGFCFRFHSFAFLSDLSTIQTIQAKNKKLTFSLSLSLSKSSNNFCSTLTFNFFYTEEMSLLFLFFAHI